MSKMADPNELAVWRGALQFAGDGFDQITSRIHEFHRAISDQPFRALAALPAPGSSSVRALHDGITDGVYGAVRLTGSAVFGAATALLRQAERTMPAKAVRLQPRAALAIGAVAGLVGDHAAVRRNPLTPRLGFFDGGVPLSLDAASLATAYPQASHKLVVFVHGLACSEHAWWLYEDPARPDTRSYGERLMSESGCTPLYVRYNSGLHISQNGRRLARALSRLVAAWPVPVEDIVLIGHSMGGLVARAAAAHAHTRGDAWAGKVRNIVCIGSPHLGAPLEQAVDGLTGLLAQFSLSRPWGRVLEARSVGIRDLKYGATSDADWRAGRARQWRPAQPLARLPRARYHFIGSSIGLSANDPLSRFLGDGLVRLPSSLARELADADTATLFGLHHMQLLNHPAVYAQIRAAL